MPVYLCNLPAAALDDARRERIAGEVTRIHCELTGAPATFAHVVFAESEDDPEGATFSVLGTIRAGRSASTKAELASQIAEAVAKTLEIEPDRVAVTTTDVPASWVMEGGAVLPEPGEEESWLARHG